MRLDVGVAISGGLQFVGDVGIGPHQAGGRFVKRGALRFPLLKICRDLRVAAEIVDVLQLTLRRFDRLAEQRDGFERIVQALAALASGGP